VRADRRPRCDRLADRLVGVAGAEVELDPGARRHVERCLRCQARAARQRRLHRALHAVQDDVVLPAPGLLSQVAASIDGADRLAPPARQATRRALRAAALGGIAAATAAGAAAVLVSRSRRRVALAG
jgi:hypothetical protein